MKKRGKKLAEDEIKEISERLKRKVNISWKILRKNTKKNFTNSYMKNKSYQKNYNP
jgi:hypothetical protein